MELESSIIPPSDTSKKSVSPFVMIIKTVKCGLCIQWLWWIVSMLKLISKEILL